MTYNDVVILNGGCRTPFGKLMGFLYRFSAVDLGTIAAEEAMKRSGVQPKQIDHVVFGVAQQSDINAFYGARHIVLRSGIPEEVPAYNVARICASGIQSVADAEMLIKTGRADIVLAGGTESMSSHPYILRNLRTKLMELKQRPFGKPWTVKELMDLNLGDEKIEDQLWYWFVDPVAGMGMAATAQNLADKYKISRQEQDELAWQSHMRATKAYEDGKIQKELVPVDLGNGNKFEKDENVRPDTTLEKLSKLPPVFDPNYPIFKQGGTITAGNASGIVDGAGAVIVAREETAKKLDLEYAARIKSWSAVGVPPEIMGIGPVPAIKKVLEEASLKMSDIGYFEINEAFAAQILAVKKELNLDHDRLNVNGGAIAIGHPLAATGARIIITGINEMFRRGDEYFIASACIGGGQGQAILLENTRV
jgi:acetyl-CoA acetyltransferase family protein